MELYYEGTFYKDKTWKDGILKSNETNYKVSNGSPFFGSECEGDQFTDEDIKSWTTGGHFKRVWKESGIHNDFYNDTHHLLTDEISSLNLPIMEIACWPNMGLIPHVVSKNNTIPCLATDACPQIIETWQSYLSENPINTNISFASFNAVSMPIRSNSVDVITSNLGFSSLRYAGVDCENGIKEAFRVLKKGGYIFAIEGEYDDMSLVNKVFELWNQHNWYANNKLKWRERFEKAGFEIVYEKLHSVKKLRDDDSDFSKASVKYGIDINFVTHAYKLKKK